jgi:hypothetical protein
MADPLTTAKTILSLGKLALSVNERLKQSGATARMREAMEIDHRSYQARREVEVNAKFAHLESRAANLEELSQQVGQMIADRQFLKVQANLEWEAARESLDERRGMLACAAAGLSDPQMSINEKARIERVLRQLDPEDVRLLHSLHHLDDTSFAPNPRDKTDPEEQRKWHNARQRVLAAQEKPMSQTALVAAGCMFIDFSSWGGATGHITALGERLLLVLSSFVESTKEAATDAATT